MIDPARSLSRLQRIENAVQQCSDKKLLRLLYRAWNAEVLGKWDVERKAA